MPETIWSARSVTANSAWMNASAPPAAIPISRPRTHEPVTIGTEDAEERAHQQHALERDVDDAAALGEQAAERGEDQRRRVAQHRREQRRPDDHALEVADARLRRGDPARHADARRSRPRPSRAAARPRPPPTRRPAGRATRARSSGPASGSSAAAARRRTRARRARSPPSRRARTPASPAAMRRAPPVVLATLMRAPPRSLSPPRRGSFRRSRQRYTTRMSALTNSTIRPWMIDVSAPASSGWKTAGSRLRTDVPVSSAPNSSAENSVPIAVLRPSSATAMPRKPIWETWTSLVAIRNCQPSTSSEPASPANAPQIEHHEDVVARHRDARRARRLGVEADRADLVAGHRAVEHHPEDDQRRERDEEADVQALQLRVAPEHRQLRARDDVVGHGHVLVGVALERARRARTATSPPSTRSS